MKTLVAYFSVSGVTRKSAEKLGMKLDADLFEIRPQQPYSDADLNWRDDNSRTTKEKNNPSDRPAIVSAVENINQYDTVYIGFPIWWYTAPRIIETFIESNDLSNKTIKLFATSGSSTADQALADMKKLYQSLNFTAAKRIGSDSDIDALIKA